MGLDPSCTPTVRWLKSARVRPMIQPHRRQQWFPFSHNSQQLFFKAHSKSVSSNVLCTRPTRAIFLGKKRSIVAFIGRERGGVCVCFCANSVNQINPSFCESNTKVRFWLPSIEPATSPSLPDVRFPTVSDFEGASWAPWSNAVMWRKCAQRA